MAWPFFRKGSEMFCSFVAATFFIYVLVISITIFNTSYQESTSTSLAPSPSAHEKSSCNTNKLRDHIIICELFLACFETISLLLMYVVRTLLDTAHTAHERDVKHEEAEYKKARDALRALREQLNAARLALGACNKEARALPDDEARRKALVDAADEEERLERAVETAKQECDTTRPKEGIERMPGWLRFVVRLCFFLSVVFSELGSVSAGYAFYYSQQIQLRCESGGFLEIFSFSLVGVFLVAFHFFFKWISVSRV